MAAQDTYTVERRAEVSAPPAQVYAALVDFHEWVHWSPWEDLDPDQRRTYSGPDAGLGAAYAWEGNRKVGAGRMEITEATEPTDLALDLVFLRPFKSECVTRFHLEPSGAGTLVTWTMEGPRTFSVKVMGLFTSMDKMVGKDFEKGLARLDAHLGG